MYFGGLGAGKGWEKFFFFISKELLKEIIEVEKCIVLSNITLNNLEEKENLDEIINQYQNYIITCTTKNVEILNKIQFTLYLTSTMAIYKEEEIIINHKLKKIYSPNEPIIIIQSSTLDYQNNKLHTDILSKTSFAFGLCLSYPKVISLKSEKHALLYKTETLSNSGLTNRIIDQIRSETKICSIETLTGIKRMKFHIQKELIESINASPVFIGRQFTIK